MKKEIMTPEKLHQSLSIKDLTDPANGIHAINLAVGKIANCLASAPGWPKLEIKRGNPITTVADSLDRLYFPVDSISRSSTYTRYVTENTILRVHTTCMIPDILREVKSKGLEDYAVLCPGICYRRDVVDRKHTGAPHQMDIWRIKRGIPSLKRPELIKLIETVIYCVSPGAKYRANEVSHPYTLNGLEVEVETKDGWLEVLECGETHPQLLVDADLDPVEYSGLAMGIGLDRLVMIVKGIDDIRLLRAEDPRISRQMETLEPYKPVSKYPPIRQDLSVSVLNDTTEEDICETIRETLGETANVVEEIRIVSETDYKELPRQATERLGIKPGQKNLLVRIILRSPERSLRHEEANEMRDRIYRRLHQGDRGYV